MVANLDLIREENEIINIFCDLVKIPSPSLKEENVVEWIKDFSAKHGLNFRTDNYGNVYIKIDSTDNNKESIIISAHMDVVGDDSPIELQFDGQFIKANGRTLGADDKVGVACGLLLAKELATSNIPHGGLEIVFTRDEETGMSGIEHLEFDKLTSKQVLVCDADKLGQLQISGASYTNAKITVKASSPRLSESFKILVYPPLRVAYFLPITENNCLKTVCFGSFLPSGCTSNNSPVSTSMNFSVSIS